VSRTPLDPGTRLFARYAHAPNALGYCGPADAQVLELAATGTGGSDEEVRRAASRFSGAWPYQQLIAELTGLDPLSEQVGRAYWTGSALTGEVDRGKLGDLLLARFGNQAGHYWAHLTPDLLTEVTPTHIFHVLGVYPWTRLLATGAPEPLEVLDGCRIRVGQVVAVGDRLTVAVDRLVWDGSALQVGPPGNEEVDFRTPNGTFLETPQVGDLVAVHWGFACDRLTSTDAEVLLTLTSEQVELTNLRLP